MGGMLGERGVKGESGTAGLGKSISLAKKLDDTKGAGREALGIKLNRQTYFMKSTKAGDLLAKGSQNKFALEYSLVRYRETFCLDYFIIVQQDIQVNTARTVLHSLLSTQCLFDILELV